MSDEPLYCPSCGAVDFACPCVRDDERRPLFCEICGTAIGPNDDLECYGPNHTKERSRYRTTAQFDAEHRRIHERMQVVNVIGASLYAAALTKAACDGMFLDAVVIGVASLALSGLVWRWIH